MKPRQEWKRYSAVTVSVLLLCCVLGILISPFSTALATPSSGFMSAIVVRAVFEEIRTYANETKGERERRRTAAVSRRNSA